MSRTLSINSGSRLNLKAWLRGGCREKARQMRLMLLWLSPVAGAASAGDEWVAVVGFPVGARQHAFPMRGRRSSGAACARVRGSSAARQTEMQEELLLIARILDS